MAAIVAVALAFGTAGTGTASGQATAWDTPAWTGDSQTLFDDPAFESSLADAIAQESAAQTARAGSEAREDRAESTSAFADLGGVEALALAQERFPQFMTEDLGSLGLSGDARVESFTGSHTARVVEDGDTTLLISNQPVAVEENGRLQAIDLSLELAAGEGFTSVRPAVDVVIPEVANEHLDLPNTGVGVRPADSAQSMARVAEDRVFFPEIETDTDYIATPTRDGAELLWQLRSAASPEQLGVDLALPAGASVRIASTLIGSSPQTVGTAQIVRDGAVIAALSAPIVLDADRVNVPAEYRFEGGELTIAVPHRGRDVRYPLLVDPQVYEYWTGGQFGVSCPPNATNPSTDPGRWTFQQQYAGGLYTPMCGSPETAAPGLFIYAPAGTYVSDSWAMWEWAAPWGAYIRDVWFDGLRHFPISTYQFTGLSGPGGWSADMKMNYQNEIAGVAEHHADPNALDRAYTARVGVYNVGSMARPNGVSGVRGVTMRLDDTDVPAVTGGPNLGYGGPQTRWMDDAPSRPDRNTLISSVAGHDNTLGVVNVGAAGAAAPHPTYATAVHPCRGDRGMPCPKDWAAFGFQVNTLIMPEGRNQITSYVTDATGKTSYAATPYEVRIDRSPPAITLAGELAEHVDDGLAETPTITAHVTDGDPATAASARSGVEKVKILIDGDAYDTWERGGTSCDSCARVQPWTLPVAEIEGRHTIKVIATDYRGHEMASPELETSYDGTGPAAPTGLKARADTTSGNSYVLWADGGDPALPGGIPGSGTSRYSYRYRVNGGVWVVGETFFTFFEVPSVGAGASIQVEITPIDNSEKVGTPAFTTLSVANAAAGELDNIGTDPSEPQLAFSGQAADRDGAHAGAGTLLLEVEASDVGDPENPSSPPGETPTGIQTLTLVHPGGALATVNVNCASGCPLTYSHEFAINTTLLAEGLTEFNVIARDAAGNEFTETATSIYIDKTPPASPTAVSFGHFDPDEHTVQLTWDDGRDPLLADGSINAGTKYTDYRRKDANGNWGTWHRFEEDWYTTLQAVDEDEQVDLQLLSIDSVGNVSSVKDISLTATDSTAQRRVPPEDLPNAGAWCFPQLHFPRMGWVDANERAFYPRRMLLQPRWVTNCPGADEVHVLRAEFRLELWHTAQDPGEDTAFPPPSAWKKAYDFPTKIVNNPRSLVNIYTTVGPLFCDRSLAGERHYAIMGSIDYLTDGSSTPEEQHVTVNTWPTAVGVTCPNPDELILSEAAAFASLARWTPDLNDLSQEPRKQSKQLRKELEARPEKPANATEEYWKLWQAHHIVPWNARKARAARALMFRACIHPNDKRNGIWLRYGSLRRGTALYRRLQSEDRALSRRTYHPDTLRRAYYSETLPDYFGSALNVVNQSHCQLTGAGGQTDVLQRLATLKNGLSNLIRVGRNPSQPIR